jgi:hypothetical protein
MRKRSGLTESERSPATRGEPDDSEEATLPASHAFVVQFRPEAALERGHYVGRVEHVLSGQAAVFHTLKEMLDFLTRVLARVTGGSASES